MKKAMKKQRKTNENIMNFHCKFMRFYLVVYYFLIHVFIIFKYMYLLFLTIELFLFLFIIILRHVFCYIHFMT